MQRRQAETVSIRLAGHTEVIQLRKADGSSHVYTLHMKRDVKMADAK